MRLDTDIKLKMLGLGGMWYCYADNRTYDTYEDLRINCFGIYGYLGKDNVPITQPDKYEFFNPESNKGYFVPGGLWSKRLEWYDSMEECEQFEGSGKCSQWNPPESIYPKLENMGTVKYVGKWCNPVRTYDNLEECERYEGKGKCHNIDPTEYAKALGVLEERVNQKSRVASSRTRDRHGRFR